MTPYGYNTENGKKYRVIYRTPDGKQHQKRGFATKGEARSWYRHKMVEIDNHGFVNNDHVTFKEITKRWLSNKKHTVISSTYKKYETECRIHLLPALGDKLIKDISVSECQLLTFKWSKKLKFYNKLVNDASSIFELAIKYNLVHNNPFKEIERPKIQDERKVRSFTKSEFEIFEKGLKEYYEPRNYKAFTFLYVLSHTGLRKAELLGLTWGNVSFDDGLLKIKQAVTRDDKNQLIIGKTKNVYSVRNVPIGDNTVKILKKWLLGQHHESQNSNIESLKAQNYDKLVFTSETGGILSPSKPGKWLKVIENAYNLPLYVTPHGLRHTYTSLLIETSVNVNKIAAVLGHKDTSITIQVYNDLHPVTDNTIGNVIENL